MRPHLLVRVAMLRSRLALLTVLAVLGFSLLALTVSPRAAPAAPVPVHLFPKVEPDFLPVRVGTTWVWRYRDELGPMVWQGAYTEWVSALSDSKEGKIVSIGRTADGSPAIDCAYKLLVRGSGVSLLEIDGYPYKPPACMFKTDCRAGDVWTTHTYRDYSAEDYAEAPSPRFRDWKYRYETWTVTVGEYEDVEVPAGRFRALRVESVRRSPSWRSHPPRETKWYARGIGIVKVESHPAFGNRQTILLSSFAPGGE
jgi:hypothetical protein